MGKLVSVLLCLGICASCFLTLTPVARGIGPDSCLVETYYSQDSDTATIQESGSTVTQTMTVRRFGQTMANCDYKEWLQAQTSYGTNHIQWSPNFAGSAKWYLPTAHGTVTFYAVSMYPNDSETYSITGNGNYVIITLKSVGNPSPGDMNFYWKSSNLQSEYYTYSLDVVIKSCVSSCTTKTLTLVVPYIPG